MSGPVVDEHSATADALAKRGIVGDYQ